MLPSYRDITSKLGEPVWYDANGVPRYCAPHPEHASSIYADVVVFYVIGCQACRQRFLVEDWFHSFTRRINKQGNILEPSILAKSLHYGDPPHHRDGDRMCTGVTMNCDDLYVKQFWVRNRDTEWVRVPEMEIGLDDLPKE